MYRTAGIFAACKIYHGNADKNSDAVPAEELRKGVLFMKKARKILTNILVYAVVAVAVFMMIFTIVSVNTFNRNDRVNCLWEQQLL